MENNFMEPNFVRILIWLGAVAVVWISARAIVSLLGSDASGNSKATWIALIVCAPIIGPVAYWLCSGGIEFSNGTPAEREALLKARINKNEN
jgi:hypothetical protein